MLVLSRKAGQQIRAGDVLISVLEIRGRVVRLGFEAPKGIRIMRTEIEDAAQKAGPRLNRRELAIA